MAVRGAAWYAVSVLLSLERRTRPRYLVFENTHLVRATSLRSARRRGTALGRADVNAGADMRWDGRPARLAFAGIRKVVLCAPDPSLPGDSIVRELHDGVEATYSRFLVRGTAELRKLVEGKPVAVVYEE